MSLLYIYMVKIKMSKRMWQLFQFFSGLVQAWVIPPMSGKRSIIFFPALHNNTNDSVTSCRTHSVPKPRINSSICRSNFCRWLSWYSGNSTSTYPASRLQLSLDTDGLQLNTGRNHHPYTLLTILDIFLKIRRRMHVDFV